MRDIHEQALRADGDGYHARNHASIGTIADPAFLAMEQVHKLSVADAYPPLPTLRSVHEREGTA